MPPRKSSRQVGGGDSFEAGVKTDLTAKMTLEQMLEGGAVLIPGGRVVQVEGRTSAKALRQETAVWGMGAGVEVGTGW